MMFLRAALVAITLLVSSTGMLAHADTVETFARADETWDVQVSPDGKHLALGCSPLAELAICIYQIDSDARPKLIQKPEGARITGIYWASDTHLLYSVNLFETLKTSSGLRDVRVDRLLSYNIETADTAMLMKNARAVTNTTRIDSLLENKPDKVMMSFTFLREGNAHGNSRLQADGKREYIVYHVDLDSGTARVEDTSSRSIQRGIFDQNGERYAEILRDSERRTYEIVSLLDGQESVFKRSDVARAPLYVAGLTQDRQTLIVDFDDGERWGLHTLSLVDGSIEPYTVGGRAVGNARVITDRYRGEIVGYAYTNDLREITYTDPELAAHQSELAGALGVDHVRLTSWTRDRRVFTVSTHAPGQPVAYYMYDSVAPSVSLLGGEAPWLAETALGTVKRIDYAASDGMEIPAYVTLPAGKTEADGPFPMLVLPHGGPEGRDTAAYDWLTQAFAADGYLVLQPNFRGSSGYGAAFRNAGFGEFGGKMISDINDGAAHLVETGLAKPGGYCVLGGSYGGYAALMSGLDHADGAKCVISINGVTNPFSMLRGVDTGSSFTAYWQQYMGNLFTTTGAARDAITPTERVNEMTIPVLLLHGKEDTTVPYGQAYELSQAASGQSNVRLVTMEGEDHYLGSTVARETVLRESLSFLGQHHPAR